MVSIEQVKRWWAEDSIRRWVIIGGFLYALFFSQGVPLWDDDFTSWFWKIKDQSLFHYIFEWLSPISTQPQFWGFNERPLQSIIYKVCYLISGYDSWSYFLYKSVVYAGLGGMIYAWARRLVPNTSGGAKAALAAAIFFLVAPGPLAAHILHQDLAPTAELIFLALTYVIWEEIEKTPVEWSGLPDFSDPVQKKWVLRWAGIAFLTYLGYKSKADLKLIPMILGGYVFALRRKQLGFFAFPVALMLLLAVPWGPGIFTKLPPFVPGSKGSEIGWMWQPASAERMMEFIWASGGYHFIDALSSPTISLAGILGPFLLIGMLGFLIWRMEAFDKVRWTANESAADRARIFALIWFGVVLAGTSALPGINYIFRIRYGILPLVPGAILLAWVFGLFADSMAETAVRKLPQWAGIGLVALFVIQSGINLNRSIGYRRSMGQVMISVDQVYDYVNEKYPNEKLTLMPDFRPYDYRPDSAPSIQHKEWLTDGKDLEKKFPPLKTYAISWKPSLWDSLELVEEFSGCRSASLFDRIFPCPKGTGTFLMRYIGSDPLYAQGEALRSKGDIEGARKVHEQYLAKYPLSMAAQFVIGLESYSLRDWTRSAQAYGWLEKYFPDHLGILYNYALALMELKEYSPAIDRLKYVAARDPQNYAVQINLYYTYMKAGAAKRAKATLVAMKNRFPNDAEVNRLLASNR